MPTPKALDGVKGNLKTSQERLDSGHQVDLPNVAIDLLGTPRVSAANASTEKQVDAGAPKSRIEDQVLITNWGKFEPAIRRWEQVLGRTAPAPTKPDGKDGAHRLSSEFTEWMMGLPAGWITDVGLKRNEELKACGNGVVPQQAELALRILLDGVDLFGCS
jgi:DNA (cytosine-5)-methyltransferase 1